MRIALHSAAAGKLDEDRMAAITCGRNHLLVVADGAGGTAGGAAAAQAVVQAARDISNTSTTADWTFWLQQLDREIEHLGQTTAVVAWCAVGTVCGASVGDSGAWLIDATSCIDLTATQRRKPLLGSGCATPVGFGPREITGRLLLATDGLFKYVSPRRIQQLVRTVPLDGVPAALIAAAQLPSGALHDDVAVVVAEQAGVRSI